MNLTLVLAATALLSAPLAAFSQVFPAKPIRIVVPFPPGGVDVTVRLVQNAMSTDLGQPIVIENRPGANGFIGSEHVARAAADGYTTLATSSSTLVLGPLVSSNVPFDPLKDFAPISLFYRTVSVLAAKPSLPLASGKVKVLAYYNGAKPAGLPNVPDLSQAVPGFVPAPGFIGLLGPAGVPRPIVTRLNGAVVKALTQPDIRAKIEANGAFVVASSPENFSDELKAGLASAAKSVKAAKAAGVKFE